MSDPPRQEEPLPSAPAGRIVVGLLALPSLLVFTTLLIALHAMAEPPRGATDLVAMLLLTEVVGMGVVVTLLAVIWALFAPRWVAAIMKGRVRQLYAVTAVFVAVGIAFLLWSAARGQW